MELTQEQMDAVRLLRDAELDARDGMPEELFWLICGLIPVPNVDLLIVNQKGELLLSRRNDDFFEKSWHIPGGCLRYGETLLARVQETARRELGCEVEVDPEPIAVRNVLRGDNPRQAHPRERGHHVAILYRCRLPEDYRIENGEKTSDDDGYLQWFAALPPDFMKLQFVYHDVLRPWRREQ